MEALLGEGSYGVVIQASLNDQSYALKIVPNEEDSLSSLNDITLEAEILKSIQHPNVPRFIEFINGKDFSCIVQEYLEGYPLSYYLMNGYRFNEKEVKRIIYQLLLIIKDLHSKELSKSAIIHRDLRLSNVLHHKDRIFVIDFGLARFLDSDEKTGLEENNHVSNYQCLRKEISPKSDLFGVGVVAIDLFTNWIEDEALFAQPWEQVLPLSKEFAGFVRKLLNEDQPFASASEALDEFLYLLSKQ